MTAVGIVVGIVAATLCAAVSWLFADVAGMDEIVGTLFTWTLAPVESFTDFPVCGGTGPKGLVEALCHAQLDFVAMFA